LINDCQNTLDKWYRVYSSDNKSVQVTEEVIKPLYEDLNTPGYIANLHKLYESANKGKDKDLFISACKFIGLFNENKEQWENYKKNKASISEAEINTKIDLRIKAREDKDYKEADRIRDELFDKGVLIEDKDGKTLWKFK
jgi:cysteinyl-tRNA synthetase